MKKAIFVLTILFPVLVLADSGFDKLVLLFDKGTALNISALQTIEQGVYVGRCFTTDSNKAAGAFITFKNESPDSGPIALESELSLIWGSQPRSNFYDTVVVKDLVAKLPMLPAPMSKDGVSREVEYLRWTVQFRLGGNYIVQRNIEYGEATSYCYYYQFRSL